VTGLRSPFTPPTELDPVEKDEPKKDDKKEPPKVPAVAIDLDGIAARLMPVPVPPGNYKNLAVTEKALFWLSSPAGQMRSATLQTIPINHDFYDRGMHGLDWPAMRKKYEPLLTRVTDREELDDLIAQMVSELSALHIFVRAGDLRKGPDDVTPARLGTVLGTRTWGGEIWLTSSNRLVDKGMATAAEFGVFDRNGTWLIEDHGVEPDVVIDNLPHATFQGEDAQLTAAVKLLQKKLREQPITLPPVPPFPRKTAAD
jgi:hypothetical protein